MANKKLTSGSGAPYYEHQDSQTVGARGPVLLQDFQPLEAKKAVQIQKEIRADLH